VSAERLETVLGRYANFLREKDPALFKYSLWGLEDMPY